MQEHQDGSYRSGLWVAIVVLGSHNRYRV